MATSESSSKKLFPVLHLYFKLATSDSSSEKLFPVLHLYYKAPKSFFPSYICTTNWPGLSPKSPKRAFRTRLPSKVKRTVSRTSFSYETSSKSAASSLQNERFVRDFLQMKSGKSLKRTLACISRARHARSPLQRIYKVGECFSVGYLP